MSQNQFENKKVLITGSSSGIGSATAKLFAEEGAFVGVHYYSNHTGAEQTLDEVKKVSDGILLQADVRQPKQIKELISRFTGECNGIDILVNNAGDLIKRVLLEEASIEYQDNIYNTNVKSVVMATQYALPFLKKSKGSIVNIGSVAGQNTGAVGSGLYAAAKAAVHTLTMAMAKEFAKYKIRVNSVLPGFIETPFHERYSSNERKKAVAFSTPLGRNGTPEDVARAILFLSGEGAGFITGEYIAVNGGLYVRA